jgi:hypothetical protein
VVNADEGVKEKQEKLNEGVKEKQEKPNENAVENHANQNVIVNFILPYNI